MSIEPTAAGKVHSQRLSQHIRRHIAAQHGWIGFDQFMEQALYAPDLGYYSAGATQFGGGGDFITAPLMGNITARCLAAQCGEVLACMGYGDVIEFGAGTGHLAADLLRAMDAMGRLPARYLILETSAALRARQQETLADCGELRERVHWLEQLPERGFDGVVLANEVLDAMPAIRFEMGAQGEALALGVTVGANGGAGTARDDALSSHSRVDRSSGTDSSQPGFRWCRAAPLPMPLQRRLDGYALDDGYRSEIGLRAEGWVRSVGEKINTGVMLLLDYGFPRREFYHAERRHGTLMCHYRHVAHDDPFFYPGLQDISVHVDFTAIACAAQEVALTPAGFTSQGAFLLSLGALDMLAASQQNAEPAARAVSQQIKKLTLPHEMGELFKVIAFSRNYAAPLSGFAMKDRRGTLFATPS